MASFTIELRSIIETLGLNEVVSWFSSYDLSDYLSADQIEAVTASGWTKEKLANKIINNYEMREIGFETPTYFAKRAAVFMNQIMEEKAPLIYAKTKLIYPLQDINITETFNASGRANSTNTSTSDGSGLTVNSNTPQGEINKATILSGHYASSTSANEGESKSNSQDNTNSQNEYIKTIQGNQRKSQSELFKEFQKSIIAIDKEIIDRAGCLFMNIYNEGY